MLVLSLFQPYGHNESKINYNPYNLKRLFGSLELKHAIALKEMIDIASDL